MKDLGEAKKIFGMEIQRDIRKGTISILEETSIDIWGRW